MTMTDPILIGKAAVAALIRGVTKKTAILAIPAVAVALALPSLRKTEPGWWFVPASVLCGCILGLINFRWLAVSVERVYLRKGATRALATFAAAVIGLLKLAVIFVVLFIVIRWRLLHILGLVAGFSLCFAAILWEGVTHMKQTLHRGG